MNGASPKPAHQPLPAIPFSYPSAARFYIPLMLQSISQSLTYPLVATITSRGPGGVINLAAFAQAQSLLFVLGTIGSGLLTTGLVHARSTDGYRRFYALNRLLIYIVTAIQLSAAVPAIGQWIFGQVLGLPAPLDLLARRIFLLLLPAQILLLMRNPYQVSLYNAHATARANAATAGRMLLTLFFSPLFIALGWVGPYWAVLAFTVPIAIEAVVSRAMAKPFLARLPRAAPLEVPSLRALFAFCMPLSLGGFFLSLSTFIVGAFIARAPDPARMLAIHYIVMGLVNPVSFAAIRLQAVVLGFPPLSLRDSRTFRFALVAGAALALLPQLVQLPALQRLYFGGAQNLPAADIPLARLALLLMLGYPLAQAMRGHAEGLAAWARQPNAILAGQSVFLSTLCVTLFLLLSANMPGYLMGVTALILAALAAGGAVRMAVWWSWEQRDRFPLDRRPPENAVP